MVLRQTPLHPLTCLPPLPPLFPRQGYSSWVVGIIMRCLSAEPSRRPSADMLMQECNSRLWDLWSACCRLQQRRQQQQEQEQDSMQPGSSSSSLDDSQC